MSKYINKKSNNNPQFNLSEHKKKALEEHDKEKLTIIERLEIEIEKLLIIKKIREDQKLLNIYQRDINNVMQEGSYNLIEMILLKEIELLEIGDFEAISMLNDLKRKADEKIKKLSEMALQMHENQAKVALNQQFQDPVFYSKPVETYTAYTKYEGFHLEKTMGGDYIQTLDADIKNLVGSDIVNSKPEQLSQNIIAEIKNIKHGTNSEVVLEDNNAVNVNNTNSNSSIIKKSITKEPSKTSNDFDRQPKGEWTDLVKNQEKQRGQEGELENNSLIHKK